MKIVIQRNELQSLEKRIYEQRMFIQVVYGPRQIGKTTLVSQLIEKITIPSVFISADGVSSYGISWIEQQWNSVRMKIKTEQLSEFVLVIDEIQKIENWSEIIKALWDEDTRTKMPIKLILLGSSRLLLQTGLTESLAGRFETLYLGHWSFDEMNRAFGWDADTYAWFGGYPGSAELIADEERWKRYVKESLIETSISKDILMLTRIDKPALIKRLFELGCEYSGQILSYTKMLGQLLDVGNTVTLSHYLDLLDTAGLLTGIEKYSPALVRQRSSSPKFQVQNTALISSQRMETFSEIQKMPEKWGRIIESSVGAHILNNAISGGYDVYYWREKNDEIDFVMKKRGVVVGIEVKSGMTLKVSGMKAFSKIIKPDKVYLIGNSGILWQDFLKMKPEMLF